MPKKILITRPEEDAKEIIQPLQSMGLEVFVEPLLDIVYESPQIPLLKNYDALIFTSANAVRGYSKLSDDYSMPAYVVGNYTAEKASETGFSQVISAKGTAQDLLKAIKTGQRYLYLRGENIRHPLQKPNTQIDELIVYKAHLVDQFSQEFLSLLQNQDFNIATFYSVRTAENFVNLTKKHGCTSLFLCTKALCLSESVLKSVSVLPWKNTYVSKKPDRQGIFDLIEYVMQEDKIDAQE